MGIETDLSDLTALVTGGGRGLGQAYAQALAAAGAKVAVTARTTGQLAETVTLIEGAGADAVALTADVSSESEVAEMVAGVVRKLGRVDILVNNAAIPGPLGLDWETDPGRWWRTLEINLRGPYLCARAVLPGMIARRRGRIINVSSSSAYDARPYATPYRASKAALTHWARCLALETEEFGISVFSYEPGAVRTAMMDQLIQSPDMPPLYSEDVSAIFEQDRGTPLEQSVRRFMFLASGRADPLSGRHISVNDDETELLRLSAEIREHDLYTLGVRKNLGGIDAAQKRPPHWG